MMMALAHLKPYLKDLIILVEGKRFSWAELENCPIGSFADFEKLVSMDVASYILIGSDPEGDYNIDDDDADASVNAQGFPKYQRLVDSLPPTLKYLSLRDIQPYQVEHILELASQKEAKTSLLSKLNHKRVWL